jgi:peptidoglycan/LPS O-acetylase OafA/YrhL
MLTDPPAAERPTGVASATTYLPELEGLRGVAMLLVLFFHTDALLRLLNPAGPAEWVSPVAAFVRNGGDLGVGLFFVLSGFLLTLPFVGGASAPKTPSIRRYLERRALRILPLYYVVVLVATLYHTTQPADLLRGLPYLAFLNAVPGLTDPLLPFSGVWWSLATEAEFYIVLAIAVSLCRTAAGRLIAIGGLVAWAAGYAAWLAGAFRLATGGQWALGFSLFGRAPFFLAGWAVALLFVRYGRVGRRPRSLVADLCVLCVTAVLAFVAQWVVSLGVSAQTTPWHLYHVFEAALCAGLLWLLVATLTRFQWLLTSWPMVQLGVLSYSMYVWHPAVMGFVILAASRAGVPLTGWTWPTILTVAGAWLGCIAVSVLTYRAVERPFLRRKERLQPAS